MMALDGESLQLIGRVLNHTEPKTTEVYARWMHRVIERAISDRSGTVTE